MDEQSRDFEAATRAEATEGPPEEPKEEPVPTRTALLLAGGGAFAILAIFALVMLLRTGVDALVTPTPTAVGGEFSAVRQKASEALARSQAQYDAGQYDLALIEIDAAILYDPDNRADIQELLQKIRQAIIDRDGVPTVQPTSTPRPTSSSGGGSSTSASPTAAAVSVSLRPGFRLHSNREQGVSIQVPSDWTTVNDPPPPLGEEGVVSFVDPSEAARFVISRDPLPPNTTPELYAARLQTQMKELAGFADEQSNLIKIGNLPGVLAIYVLNARSPDGSESSVRVMQTYLGSGRTVIILTGESGANQFEGFKNTFDTITRSFRPA